MIRFLTIVIVLGLLTFVGCREEKKSAESKIVDKADVQSTKKLQKSQTSASQTAEEVEKTEMTSITDIKPPRLEDVGDPTELAVIMTEKGNMIVEFFPDVAPLHVANFKNLAKAGFYDGTTFHRVLPGFMIQGGDPNSKDSNPNNDGQGGPPYSVKAEFNSRIHEKGILSMARSNDPNSAGSQFFICLARAAHLDNKYTVFGKLVRGVETLDKIGGIRRDPSNRRDRSLPAVVMHQVKIIKRDQIDKYAG